MKSELANTKPSTLYPYDIPALSANRPTRQQQPQLVVQNIMSFINNGNHVEHL
jgi:hypothetical protein